MNLRNRYIQDMEKKARETLEATLEPGETLLAFCQAKYIQGIWSNQEFCVGLTQKRVVLVNRKKKNKAYSIGLPFIEKIWTESLSKNNSKAGLRIVLNGFPGETSTRTELVLTLFSFWVDHGAHIADQYAAGRAGLEDHSLPVTIPHALELIKDLEAMGADNASQALLKTRFEADPYFQADAEVVDLYHKMTEGKLAMRVAAVIYGVVILFLVWFAVQGQATLGFGVILAGVAIYSLIRGNAAARRSALTLALLTVFINILLNLMAASLIDTFMWAAFGVAMSLLLVGKPGRLRIVAGVGVFALGSVGLFALFILGSLYAPESVRWLAPQAKAPFTEDFAALHKWAAQSNDQASVGWENGAYGITIKKAQVTYFSFPPINFFPIQGEVDAWAPKGDAATQRGFFGMTCRYQKESEKYYLIYIDPTKQTFLVDRMRGTEETPLTNPIWQPAKGLKADSATNRIGLTCQDNQITLTINGIAQTPIEDPEMATFGDGRMGLMAGAVAPDAAQGFKMLFDNAKFWPSK